LAANPTIKNIVIVGGGFGGLSAATVLCKSSRVHTTLIDRRNYHLFQPLLYQIAMAGLSPAEIAVPIRGIFSKNENVEVLLGNIETVDLKNETLITDIGDIRYDYLVLACGAKHSYFGNETWESFAPGLKTLEQATEIRRRILTAFERAETETDKKNQDYNLTFVIVGGGPTGVELAGAIAEISQFTLTRDFRRINPNITQIILAEAGPRILPSFSVELSAKATKTLEKLGVQVRTSSKVTNVSNLGVNIGNEFLPAKTVLWAAGVKPSSINSKLGVLLDKDGKVIVESDLSLKSYPNVFVIGDQAHFEDEKKNILPSLAPVAIQQGKHVAKNILLLEKGLKKKTFHYSNRGQLATIGRRTAVLEYRNLKMHGFFAWVLWLLVHIYYLIGFRNRIFVLMQWAWQYIGYSRGARLIIHKEWRSFSKEKKDLDLSLKKGHTIDQKNNLSLDESEQLSRWEMDGGL
jgi:NADH dehydrogenase